MELDGVRDAGASGGDIIEDCDERRELECPEDSARASLRLWELIELAARRAGGGGGAILLLDEIEPVSVRDSAMLEG